jgi:hypothetical protein
MINLQLSLEQYNYLRHAVRRDLDTLEDMAPWEIDDQGPEWEIDIRLCKGMAKLLDRVEQEQVVPY